MDVIPIVGKEVATRFHKTANESNGDVGDRKSTAALAAVTGDLTSQLVRLWLLGSDKTDEAGNVGDTAEHIEELVESILHYLFACSMPNLATVLLQEQGYSLNASLQNRHRTEEVKTEAIGVRLVRAIVEKTAATATADEILGDITLYILHRYGQLQAADGGGAALPAHKETATVLCSVLPRPQAINFTKQEPMEKQRQLEELRRIVWGIRIFNKAEGKMPGTGLTELHELVETPLAAMEEALESALDRVEGKAQRCLAVLLSPSSSLSENETTALRDEYHHTLQLTANLLTARCVHRALSSRIHSVVIPNYNGALNELRDALNRNPTSAAAADAGTTAGNHEGTRPEAVKKRVTYPVFMQLADTYSLGVRTVEELGDVDSLLQLTLQSEASYASTVPERMAADALDAGIVNAPPPVQLDAVAMETVIEDILSKAAAAAASTAQASTDGGDEDDRPLTLADAGLRARYVTELPQSLMDPAVAECYPSSFCALRGFCPVTYVEKGLLVAGRVLGRAQDPSCAGFLVLEGGSGREWTLPRPFYFAFADEHGLRKFAADPMRYLVVCMQRCDHQAPGATLLMGLIDRLPRELYIAGSRVVACTVPVAGDGVAAAKADAETQTGQIDSYLDHRYRWNEWDLRRQALKLANLMNMRTHSSQTAASHFRRDGTTQANPPKEMCTQTMQDAATQPPRVVQYLKGLRGTESSEVEQAQRTILY